MGTSQNRMSEFRERCDCRAQLKTCSKKKASGKPWAAPSPASCVVFGRALPFREPLVRGQGAHGARALAVGGWAASGPAHGPRRPRWAC